MRKFSRSIRFLALGFTIGAGIQIPILAGMHAHRALITQICLLVISLPFTIVGFWPEQEK